MVKTDGSFAALNLGGVRVEAQGLKRQLLVLCFVGQVSRILTFAAQNIDISRKS